MNTIIPQLLLACISLQLPPHADFLHPLAGAPPPPPLHKWARGDARERGAAEKAAACQGLQGDLSTTVTGTTLAPRGKLRAQRQPHRRRAGELILTDCSLHCLSKIVTLVFDNWLPGHKLHSQKCPREPMYREANVPEPKSTNEANQLKCRILNIKTHYMYSLLLDGLYPMIVISYLQPILLSSHSQSIHNQGSHQLTIIGCSRTKQFL